MKLLLDSIESQDDNNIICSITDLKGTILYANPKFCEISGYNSNELVGANHNIINSKLHTYNFFSEMWRTIAAGKIWQGEIRNKNKNGAYYWVDTIIFPVADSQNAEAHYLSVRTLIDDKKYAEQRREQRIIELQDLLHTISHQMRQPITQIMGLMEVLGQLKDSSEEFPQVINFLNSSVEKLNTYTKDLTRQVENIAKQDKI